MFLRKGYTFFAPTNWAFARILPQDIADPFLVDIQFRTKVLLHHFALQNLTTEFWESIDSLNLLILTMASNKEIELARIRGVEHSPGRPNFFMYEIM